MLSDKTVKGINRDLLRNMPKIFNSSEFNEWIKKSVEDVQLHFNGIPETQRECIKKFIEKEED